MKFYPFEKGGGGGKGFSHAEVGLGHKNVWDSFYTLVLAILKAGGRAQKVSTL